MSDQDAVNLALLAFRVAIGIVFLAHGINHIFRGGKIAGTGRWFESLGMRPGVVHAWMASLVEVGAGILLVLGLGMPLAGAGVMGTMLVAWITNHRKNGFFIFRPGEGYEYVMTLTFCGLALGTVGGGEWGLDHAIFENDLVGVTGLFVTLIGGVGGALLLLAAFWRPEKK
ncbi:MAG: putative rane protein [Acidimicrobiales bacterium]|nr:putative rane protein [Acidimicrobiales bacterium]